MKTVAVLLRDDILNNKEIYCISKNLFLNLKDKVKVKLIIHDNYNNYEIVHKDMVVKEIEVLDSKISNYLVRTNDNVTLFLPIDYDKNKVTIEYEGLDSLSYKNKVNDKIGIIKYY